MNRAILKLPRCYPGAARILPSATHAAIPRHSILTTERLRTLTSTSCRAFEPSPSPQSTSGIPSSELLENIEPKPASESSQHIPWYLQEETSVPEQAEASSSDHLPELPENPPKLLPVLLEYVYKDLGLDGLKLYDLRGFETPPALGANVIMIMGTVRSVKHLNVSADRLCRWLRSNYKLSPYADGLLGRNELKIKLRRKNRRARLASRTGGVIDDKDDGITTGWICVNAGVVEKAAAQEVSSDAFEGFGHLGGGTRLVVQLFTEEKRAELDLESLWEGRIRRAQQEKIQHSDAPADAPEEVRFPSSISPPSSDSELAAVPRSFVTPPLEQRRHFHTRRRHIEHGVSAMRHFRSWSTPVPKKEGQSDITWAMLRDYLENLPDEQLEAAMNRELDENGHNDLLSLVEQSLSGLGDEAKFMARMELEAIGLNREHPQYTKENLLELFEGYLVWALPIDDHIVAFVLQTLLAPRGRKDPNESSWWLPDSDREVTLKFLEHLSLSGRNLMNMEMWYMLYQSASLPSTPEGDSNTPAERSAHVLRMIEGLEIPFDPVHARLLMAQIFRNGDHESFWKWWRKLPLNNSPRTGNDYAQLFALHADVATGAQIRECLDTWIPLMRSEEPQIDIEGPLATDIMECLKKLQPDIKKQADSGSTTAFADLWRDLSDLLPPSIRYILAVATHRHPRYLLRVLNSFDEVYAVLSLIVERYYLRNFGGSFTENFYSLKRERVLLTKNGEIPRAQLGAPGPVRDSLKLRTADVWKNLLIMVGIPYLKRKLDEGYDIHAAPQASLIMSGGPRYNPSDDLPPNPTIRQRLMHAYKWFLRNVYPSVNAAYYFSILAFNLAYLFDNTKYSSPFLWLIGSRIRRLSSADHHAIAKILDGNPQNPRGARSRPGSGLLGLLSPQNLYPQLLTSLRYFLPASIFALKFLEWWHASDFSRQLARKATDTLELPAPITKGMIPPSERKQKPSTEKQQDPATSSPSRKSALKSSPTKRMQPPISASSYLPIFTVPLPPAGSDAASSCPVCLNQLTNPTACQTGYVYCYVCIFHWLNGEHQRQLDFMNGEGAGAAWEDDLIDGEDGDGERNDADASRPGKSRQGKWESGKGRCPVTGRKVLGGTEGLRRVLI
ncbi:Pex12 amino terminal region-domain-containing protein [Aspergillus granulosus]|uniref:ATPase synthesis protein 25 n=1 Tax=Aspergillus granulosus TaxID=176169 RepID=A0ABR4HUR6_9EURO